jgi:membrane protease subunit (stomatin/prohibitin family)
MGTNNVVFLEVIEWLDPTGDAMVQRIPESGSGEIKYGAQLVLRESQAGVFFYNGRAFHVFGPGRHTLVTGNLPILNKIMAIPWGLTSPLRAEAYILNMKVFANQKWGTKDPVAFKDSKLGLIRLRANGLFTVRIVQPLLFINSLVGTVSQFTTSDVCDYLSSVIVSRFNDYLGEHLDSMLNLPGRYDEIAAGLLAMLAQDFARFGLALPGLYINSITPPLEVQKAIDDRSKLGLFDNLNDLMKMKSAMALEKAAENPSAASQGISMGMGLYMPALLSQQFQQNGGASADAPAQQCPDCKKQIPADAQFCLYCGHQVLVFAQCVSCGKNIPPGAKFCPRCGTGTSMTPQKKRCAKCGFENLYNATFCNQCGERL